MSTKIKYGGHIRNSREFDLEQAMNFSGEFGNTGDIYFNEPIISVSKEIKLPQIPRNLGNHTHRMVAPSILSPTDIRECRELKKNADQFKL